MSQPAPDVIDITDIQFKLQNKYQILKPSDESKDGCSLLATSSSRGVVFVAGPSSNLLVFPLTSISSNRLSDSKLLYFKIQLPSTARQITLSCGDNYLAVDVDLHGTPFILIYVVDSILANNPKIIQQIRVSPEPNVNAKQILWNPVLENIFALVLSNGGMGTYTLHEKGIEMNSLSTEEHALCACWSPKGKQLVAGFPSNKLMQFKPDLKLARTIVFPQNAFSTHYDIIAIQWLSTYQFATVFLDLGDQDAVPSLHIINAPKTSEPVLIKYEDICYSSPGPRKAQVFLIHLSQWNLMFMASANSMEVGLLGTNETGDFPTWHQWITSDEARAELPLSLNKEETFPVGFCLELGCTHNVLIGENKLPPMPMLHLLSTHGELVSFNVINLKPTYTDICSPPRPLPSTIKWETLSDADPTQSQDLSFNPSSQQTTSFQTSTPAPEKAQTFFMPVENKQASSGVSKPLFGSITYGTSGTQPGQIQPTPFSSASTNSNQFAPNMQYLMGGLSTNPPSPKIIQQTTSSSSTSIIKVPPTKQADPIILIPPTYTKPTFQPDKQQPTTKTSTTQIDESGITSLIIDEIQNFDRELCELVNRSKNINIGGNEEFFNSKYKNMVTNLVDLQDISKEATETTRDLTSEVQSLRIVLNEAFAMHAEAQSKFEMFNNPDYIHLYENAGKNQTNQRQLAKLKTMLRDNETQLNAIYKVVFSEWANFDELKKQNARKSLKTPTLEKIYQSLNKQQDIIHHQKKLLANLKQKIGINVSTFRSSNSTNDETVESLTDKFISLTVAERVKKENARLTETKKKNLCKFLVNREIATIKQSRPENCYLTSKIINERKKLFKEKLLIAEKGKIEQKPVQKQISSTTGGNNKIEITGRSNIPKIQHPIPVIPKTQSHFQQSHNINISKPPVSSKSFDVSAFNLPLSLSINTIDSNKNIEKTKPFSFVNQKSMFDSKSSFVPENVSSTTISKPPIELKPKEIRPGTTTQQSATISNLNKYPSVFAGTKPEIDANISKAVSKIAPATSTSKVEESNKENVIIPKVIQQVTHTQPFKISSIESPSSSSSSFSFTNAIAKSAENAASALQSEAKKPSAFSFKMTPLESTKLDSGGIFGNKTTVTLSETVGSLESKKDVQISSTETINKPIPTTIAVVNPTNLAPVVTSSQATTFSFGSAFADSKNISHSAQSTADSILQGLNICDPQTSLNAEPNPANIFSSGVAPTTTSSIFGNAATSTAMFGQVSTVPSSTVTTATIPKTESSPFSGFSSFTPLPDSSSSNTSDPFGQNTNVFGSGNQASVFGGTSIPQQSSTGGLFGSALSFGTPRSESVASPFGGSITTQTQSGGSIFGASVPTSVGNSSIFGGGSHTNPTSGFDMKPSTDSVFGSPSSTNPLSGGSLFGTAFGSTNTQPSGSIFGGTSPQATGFGSGFGSSSSTPASPFGGSSIFGQQNTSGFASPQPSTGGPFSQAIAQSQPAFGSPPAFGGSSSVFGSSPTFGGPATFGGPPAFGGGATFSSPTKSAFGSSFGTPTPQQSPAFGGAAPQNSLFEQLGSSDNAMTFGNLAQNATSNQNKPQFGGSAFSSWR